MSALSGIRVLELAEGIAGEYCGKLLADFGAEVIKIERPGHGSPSRASGPFLAGEAGSERSGLFAYLNSNKHSVELDLDSDAGVDALGKLLPRVEAVVDDHAADWLRAVGLDPQYIADTHPMLVLCAITAFGQSPPPDRLHAEDLTVFHASGWGYHTPTGADSAQPPLKGPGRFMPSYEAGLEGALCVTAALFEREVSGLGQFIDIAGQAVLASRVDYVLGQMVAGDMDVSTERSAFDLFGPAGIFPCRDGYAYIWLSAPAHWKGLQEIMGHPEWMASFPENWLERECTPERVQLCREHLAQWFSTQNKHEVEEAAQKLGIPLAAVNNAEDLFASPQYRFRGFFAEVDHPELGPASYPTVPYKLSATPAVIKAPAPRLGVHTAMHLAASTSSGTAEPKGGRHG